jgi:hypothetical protein
VRDQIRGTPETLDECGEVFGMELERKLALSLPRLRVVVAQADRNNSKPRGQRFELWSPVPIIVNCTVYENDRGSGTALDVSHGVAVYRESFDTRREVPAWLLGSLTPAEECDRCKRGDETRTT